MGRPVGEVPSGTSPSVRGLGRKLLLGVGATVALLSCIADTAKPARVVVVMQVGDCDSRSADIAVVARIVRVDSILWIGKRTTSSIAVNRLSQRLPRGVGFGVAGRTLVRSLSGVVVAPRTPMIVVVGTDGRAISGYSLDPNRRELHRQISALNQALTRR